MKKVIIGLLSLLLPQVTVAATVHTIHFRRDATSAEVRGSLRGHSDVAWYQLRARKGQHMIVSIKGAGATGGIVYFLNHKQDGGPGGMIYDGKLPATGNYRIRVSESQMANGWKGAYTLSVTIE